MNENINAAQSAFVAKPVWRVHVLVGAGLLILSSLVVYSLDLGMKLYYSNSPLLDAVREVRLEIATARMLINQVLAGELIYDQHTVWHNLDDAVRDLEGLLESGNFQFLRVGFKAKNEVHNIIDRIKAQRKNLASVVEDYLNELNHSRKFNASAQFIKAFDKEMLEIHEIEQTLQDSIAASKRRFRMVHVLLLSVCFVLAMCVALVFHKYQKDQRAGLLSLAQTNDQLRQEMAQRIKAEQALRETEKLTKMVFNISPDSIVITRRNDDTIVEVNDGFLRLTGSQREEFVGRRPPDLDIWKDLADRECFLRKVEKHGEVRNLEIELQVKNGKLITGLTSAKLFLMDDVPHILSVTRDISERKEARIKLQNLNRQKEEALALLDAVFDFAPIGLGFWDTNLRFVRINRALADINGLPIENQLGRTVGEIVPDLVSKNDLENSWRRVIETGRPMINVETSGQTRACPGQTRHWVENWYPVRVEGETIGIAATVMDITERKEAEKALRQTHDELERRVQERTLELSRANAQLKNEIEQRRQTEKDLLEHQRQLRKMSSQLVQTEECERRRFASEIHDRIGQTLAVVKIRLGSLLQALQDANLSREIEEIRDVVSVIIRESRSLTFEISPPILYELGLRPALEWLIEKLSKQHALTIEVDSDGSDEGLATEHRFLLFQAMRELLLNTIKHARANQAVVSITGRQDALTVTLQDDGVGFEVSQATKRPETALTFGLFSIKERLRHHGGTLEIDSIPGTGTRVTLTLPRKSPLKS